MVVGNIYTIRSTSIPIQENSNLKSIDMYKSSTWVRQYANLSLPDMTTP